MHLTEEPFLLNTTYNTTHTIFTRHTLQHGIPDEAFLSPAEKKVEFFSANPFVLSLIYTNFAHYIQTNSN